MEIPSDHEDEGQRVEVGSYEDETTCSYLSTHIGGESDKVGENEDEGDAEKEEEEEEGSGEVRTCNK